ncbi:hypothetical protein BGZ68_004845 [Mortierella alpina]|nr:hypothetical protein BGZ68_004845 [Mortierella alpina]
MVDGKANAKIGSVDMSRAEVIKSEESTKVGVEFNERLQVDRSTLSAIDDKLGTKLIADATDITKVDAVVEFDVDLALGPKVNAALISALGLDSNRPAWRPGKFARSNI